MTVAALKGYLEYSRPPAVSSVYELAIRYRVAEDTVRAALKANGYVYSHEASQWERQETQLDRIERKLDELNNLLTHNPTSPDYTGYSISSPVASSAVLPTGSSEQPEEVVPS